MPRSSFPFASLDFLASLLFKECLAFSSVFPISEPSKGGRILVSVKFLSAILGPEMAAPILWTPGKMPSFCRKTSMSIKFPGLGGVRGFWGGGGECRFYLYGRRDFSDSLLFKECLAFSSVFPISEPPKRGPENWCRTKNVEKYF